MPVGIVISSQLDQHRFLKPYYTEHVSQQIVHPWSFNHTPRDSIGSTCWKSLIDFGFWMSCTWEWGVSSSLASIIQCHSLKSFNPFSVKLLTVPSATESKNNELTMKLVLSITYPIAWRCRSWCSSTRKIKFRLHSRSHEAKHRTGFLLDFSGSGGLFRHLVTVSSTNLNLR